jgi:hypothetical protein
MTKPDSTAQKAAGTVADAPAGTNRKPAADQKAPSRPREIGGPTGPEPTRYGDWERNGRVSDF